MLWWLAACEGERDRVSDHTGVAVESPCALTPDNPLRVTCAYEGAEATLRIADERGERSFSGVDGAVTAWGYAPVTHLSAALEVDGREVWSGGLVTGPVPDEVALRFVETLPGESRVERLLFTTACDGGPVTTYLTEPDGSIVWFGRHGLSGGITGFDATAEGVVVLSGRRWVRELRWDGAIGLDAERDPLEQMVHHAVDVEGDRVAVLDTRPRVYPDGNTYLDDGVAEVRDGAMVNVFRLGDHLDPQGRTGYPPSYWQGTFPGAIDAFHLNAVDLLPDGGFLLSAKHLDALIAVDADGELDWVIAGSAFTPDVGDLALTPTAPVSFGFPHHVNRAPWGNLLVLDNGRDFVDSEVLELAVDEVARTVTPVRRWDLGVSCPVQGSAYGLPDGTVVATCPIEREVFELDDSGIRRRVRVDCARGEPGGILIRAKPLPAP